ncbi:efflux RND transporter periplasmic adaptor subunit [Mucilaginibacter xinganensis]|uniref:RND family efflux transporter, MFP subunit n=1 Tax=Mucilaginibacter xinganensis TaxID=1234841 RepID=A0A223NSF2_9SPHI|nr:efflux RND transporter periplasmic adaptor subunit [Mucilaginibacter xinganensis]ASU32835.1 RND family efflux transporter, MFP subunit [Mucilaginibacter xinganensis]
MYQDSIKKYYKPMLFIGLSALVFTGVMAKLSSNQEVVQNEIKQELKTVGYAARATLVKEINFSDAYTYRGAVEAGEIITLTAETDGKVVYSTVEKGNTVSKGSTLVKVDRSTRFSSYQISEDTYNKAKSDYANLKDLQDSGNASGVEVENAKLQMQNAASQLNISKKQVGQTLILAPESGTVVDKKINQGEYVTPGTALGALACLKEVLVNVFVQENEVSRLKKGAAVTVRADAYPGSIYTGKVSAIIPVASAAKTFPVMIRIINDNPQKLLAGMNVSVVFGADKRSKALVIPRTALTYEKKQAAVYLIHQSRHPVLTPIFLGKEYDTYLGVSRGLKAGDTVMTSGLLNVESGKKIQWLTIQK